MRAIFKKELRDLLPWIVVGMILIAALCWYVKGKSSFALAELLPIGFAAVAVVFGFLQSIGDMRTEAKGYLLHRAVSVQAIFQGKLLAGAVAYGATIALPMTGLAIYHEVMGPKWLPTSAVELIPSVLMGIVVFSLHPAAMWTVARQANWVGTKAVPLVVAALGSLLATTILFSYANQAYIILHWAGFAMVVLVTLWVVIAAASFAFCDSQFLPPTQNGRRLIRFDNLGILAACTAAVCFFTVSLVSIFWAQSSYPYTEHDLALSNDGQVWNFAQTTLSQDGYFNPVVTIGKVVDGVQVQSADLQSRTADWTDRAKALLSTGGYYHTLWEREFRYLTQFQFSSQSHWDVYERDNRLFIYSHGLKGVLTPSGLYDSIDDAQGSFVSPSFVTSGGWFSDRKTNNDNVGIGESLIVDRNGVYQVDWKARTIRTVLDQPNEAVALILPTTDQAAVFWVRDGSTITRYLIEPLDNSVSFELADSDLIKRTRWFRFPEFKTTQTGQWSFLPDSDGKSLLTATAQSFTVCETSDGTTLFYRRTNHPAELAQYELRANDGTIERAGKIVFPAVTQPDRSLVGLFVPPALSATLATMNRFQQGSLIMAGYLLLHALGAVVIVFWLCRYYELTPLSRNLWILAAATLGMAAPLAMWMIYPKPILERCHHCEAMRRIDRARCRQCGADWARQPLEGTEIIGAATIHQQTANVS